MSVFVNDKPATFFRAAVFVAATLILVRVAMIVGIRENESLRVLLGDLFSIVFEGLVTISLLYAAWRLTGRERLAWSVLALAQFFYLLGDMAWAILEVGLHQQPYPSVADGFYLAYYPFFALGLLIFPVAPLMNRERLKLLLDMSIIMIAAALTMWAFVIGPTIAIYAADAFTLFISLAYPVLDVVLILILFELLLRRQWPWQRGSVWLLAASVAVRVITDFIFSVQILQETYATGNLIDTGWVISYALTGLAGVLQITGQLSILEQPLEAFRTRSEQPAWTQYVPYIWVAAACALLLSDHYTSLPISTDALLWSVVSIFGLVVVRQILTLNENARLYAAAQQEIAERRRVEAEIKKLNEGLEHRVLERTTQLEAANLGLQHEIAERRQTEAALYESETRFRTLVEQLPAITYIVPFAETQRTLYVSPQIGTMLGFSQAEWLADPDLWRKQLHPDDRERVLAEDADSDITGVFSSEYRILARDGRVVWLHDLSRRVYDETGQARFSQGIEFDITHLKQTEAALRQSEAELRALFAAINDVVIVYDRAGRYLKVAPTNVSLLYKPPDEMVGKTLHEVLPAPQADLLLDHIQLALEKQQTATIDYSLNVAGREVWFAGMISPMSDETAVLVARDITERRRSETRTAAFGSLAQRLNTTTNPQEAARIIVDVADQLLGWDACFLSLFSAEQDRVFAVLAMDIIEGRRVDVPTESLLGQSTPMLRRTVNEGGQLLLPGGDETAPPDLHSFGDVSRASASLMYVPIRNGAAVIGVLSIQSYTPQAYNRESLSMLQALADHCGGALERIRAEEQIKASLREKEVLLKEIHHRVKNNLQIISSLLNLQAKSVADSQVLGLLRDSQNRVKSMALVHEKLYRSSDLARINFTEYVNSLTAQLVRSYSHESRGVELKTQIANIWLDVDTAISCGLIINELVSNALKHAFPNGHGGEICVELAGNEARQLTLGVSDNGAGFPAGVDFRNTPSLGLQLVNTLAEQIGGVVALERHPGTVFKIAFTPPCLEEKR